MIPLYGIGCVEYKMINIPLYIIGLFGIWGCAINIKDLKAKDKNKYKKLISYSVAILLFVLAIIVEIVNYF